MSLPQVKQHCPAPDYPHSTDGRSRALLPDEMIERLKVNSQHTLQSKRIDDCEAWSDDTLALFKREGLGWDQWGACSAAGDGEFRALALVIYSADEFVQGARGSSLLCDRMARESIGCAPR